MFLALISAIDFDKFSFVKGSPSSSISSDLITFSLVITFPVILILSTRVFSPSLILRIIFIELFSMISVTLCSTNCKLLSLIISSRLSKILLILNGE